MTPLEQIIAAVLDRAAQVADTLHYPDETKISASIRDAIRALPVADLAKELAPLMPDEPVAWGESYDGGKFFNTVSTTQTKHHRYPLYTHPSDAESLRAEVERLTAERDKWFEGAGAHHVASMREAQRADQNAARAEKAEADVDRQKRRADNHAETLRGVRKWLTEGDADRALLWCNDGLSGYTDTAENTLSEATARAEKAEAERDDALERVKELEAQITPPLDNKLNARAIMSAWLDETECFSTRRERLSEDLDYVKAVPWLASAVEVGIAAALRARKGGAA